jgi:hypothetical protein
MRSKKIRAILKAYNHDFEMEGTQITKRRLWYILKPQIIELFEDKLKKNANAEFNRQFNILAEAGEINDSYIQDASREIEVGKIYPQFIFAVEKATVTETIRDIARVCGFSLYVTGGQSSIYAVKKLVGLIRERTDNAILVMAITDLDKAGEDIARAMKKHFKTDRVYKILLNPAQIPEDKKDEYFDWNEKIGKCYELDILNVHLLRETIAKDLQPFSDKIEEKLTKETIVNLKHQEVENNPKVIKMQQQLNDLKRQLYADTKIDIEFVNFSLEKAFALPQRLEYISK